jgi:predicted HicB family RNase H-like nuclease
MEEIEEIFKKIKYLAIFDPDSFQVIKVGPEYAFLEEKNKIAIDDNLAMEIIEGKIRLSNCYIDLDSNSLELIERQHVSKIDDILHRVIEKKWSNEKISEIFITYNKKNKSLKFELTSMFSGTKKIKSSNQRKVSWSGDTMMNFYITEYNDPHKLIKIVSFPLNELINKNYLI